MQHSSLRVWKILCSSVLDMEKMVFKADFYKDDDEDVVDAI